MSFDQVYDNDKFRRVAWPLKFTHERLELEFYFQPSPFGFFGQAQLAQLNGLLAPGVLTAHLKRAR